MKTEINWIKYEGRTHSLQAGMYLACVCCGESGERVRKVMIAELGMNNAWFGVDDFIIEYIAPLSEIERGIEEEVNKQK